jgi:hypothetical protein
VIKYLVIGLVIASLVGALTVAGNMILDQNTKIAQLNLIIKGQNAAIEKAAEIYTKAQKDMANLQTDFNRAERSKNELAELLARHDLEKLAKAKPGRVEKIINKATAKKLQRFREFGNAETATD